MLIVAMAKKMLWVCTGGEKLVEQLAYDHRILGEKSAGAIIDKSWMMRSGEQCHCV